MQDEAHVVDNIVSLGVDSKALKLATTITLSMSDGGEYFVLHLFV